jgi:hypothetical protein
MHDSDGRTDRHAAHDVHTCATVAPTAPFKAFRALNDPLLAVHASHKGRIDERALVVARGTSLQDKLVQALVARRALPAKEVWESFEVVARARRALRGPVLVDLCCGHGLAGLLCAVFERELEELWLVDERRPDNHAAVIEALGAVAPWVPAKVRWLEQPLKTALPRLPRGASILSVHACGVRTDRAIDAALAGGGALVAVPCCYEGTAHSLPQGLVAALGVVLSVDVDRTYRLERAGWSVRWSALPAAITPMNRVLIARPAAARSRAGTPAEPGLR